MLRLFWFCLNFIHIYWSENLEKEKKKKDDNTCNTCNLTFHYNLPNKVDTVIKALGNIHLFGKCTFSCMEAEYVL